MNRLLITLLLLPALLSLTSAKGPRLSDDGKYIALDNSDDHQQSYVDVAQEAGVEPLASKADVEVAEKPEVQSEAESKEARSDETDEELVNTKGEKIDVSDQAVNVTDASDEAVDKPTKVEIEPKEGQSDSIDDDLPADKNTTVAINNDINEQAQNGTDTEVIDRPDTQTEIEPKEARSDETDEDVPSAKGEKIEVNEQAANVTDTSDGEVDRPDTQPEVEPKEAKSDETDEDLPNDKGEKIDVSDQAVNATDASDEVVDRPDTKVEVEPKEGQSDSTDDDLPITKAVDRNTVPEVEPSDGKAEGTDGDDVPFNKNEQQDQPDTENAEQPAVIPDETAGFVPDLSPEDTGFVPTEPSETEPTSGIAITGTVTDYIEPMEFIPQLEVDLTFVDNGEQAIDDNGEFAINTEEKPLEGEQVLNWFSTGQIESFEQPKIDTDGSQMQDANWTDFTEGAEAVNKTGSDGLQVEKIPHLETSQAETNETAAVETKTAAPVEAKAAEAEPVETAKAAEPVESAKSEEQGTPLEEDPNMVAYGDAILINNSEEYSIVDYQGEEPVADDLKPIDTGAQKQPEKLKVEEAGFLAKKN